MRWETWGGKGKGFPGGSVVKNLPAKAADRRDTGLIPGSGRSPGGGNGSVLAWEIPLREGPGGLQSMGSRLGDGAHSNHLTSGKDGTERALSKSHILGSHSLAGYNVYLHFTKS